MPPTRRAGWRSRPTPHDEFAVEIWHGAHKLDDVPCSDNRHISRLPRQDATLACEVWADLTVRDSHPISDCARMRRWLAKFGQLRLEGHVAYRIPA